MSAKNGDKARFGRERRKKVLRRQRTRALLKAQGTKGIAATTARASTGNETSLLPHTE